MEKILFSLSGCYLTLGNSQVLIPSIYINRSLFQKEIPMWMTWTVQFLVHQKISEFCGFATILIFTLFFLREAAAAGIIFLN